MTSPSDDYRLIPLTQGQFAKVDAADYEWIMQWKWHAIWAETTKSFYARRTDRGGGKRIAVHMHRLILGLVRGDESQSDHANRDTLDNRRLNLRLASKSENMINRKIPTHNTSGFKGVSFRKSRGTWVAIVTVGGKNKCVGSRKTPEEAYSLYCEAIVELYGEFWRAK